MSITVHIYNNTEPNTELYFWSLLHEKKFNSAYYIPLELKLQCIIFLNRHAHKMFNWQLTLFWQQILFLQALKTVDKKSYENNFCQFIYGDYKKNPLPKKPGFWPMVENLEIIEVIGMK